MTTTRSTDIEISLEEAWQSRDLGAEVALAFLNGEELDTPEPELGARMAVLRSFLLYRRGELQEALPLILDASAQLSETPLTKWHGRASNTAALIYSALGLSEPAVKFLLAGQQQAQDVGDLETAFSCFHNMGVELAQMGDFDGALENYRKAEAFVDYGLDGHAFLALNRCDLYLDKGDVEKALETVEAGRQHWQLPKSQARVFGLMVDARVAMAANDPDTAEMALKAIRAEFGDERAGAELPILEAQLCMLRGNLVGAEAIFQGYDLHADASAVEGVYLASRLVHLHARLAEQRGDYKQALAIIRSARDKENQEHRQTMSRVMTLIMNENTRQLEQKSRQLEEQNTQLNEALEELRLLHMQVNELALRDHLTGLYNRRYLAEHVDGLVQHHQRHGRVMSLMVFDVDDFKSINDTFLHSTGDVVLETIASILQSEARAGDVLCRLGGDEFVALLPDTGMAGARVMADRLHLAIQGHDWASVAKGLDVSVSIGATTARSGASLEDLLLAADRAMYGAKSAGKDQVHSEIITIG